MLLHFCSGCGLLTFDVPADLQLYIQGHSRGTSTDQQEVIVRWANVLQWFSVRASWVHSIEIRNFSEDFAAQHDCPSGVYLQFLKSCDLLFLLLCFTE